MVSGASLGTTLKAPSSIGVSQIPSTIGPQHHLSLGFAFNSLVLVAEIFPEEPFVFLNPTGRISLPQSTIKSWHSRGNLKSLDSGNEAAFLRVIGLQ